MNRLIALCVVALGTTTDRVAAEQVVATGNPHVAAHGALPSHADPETCDKTAQSCGPSSTAITPAEIITSPMVTQADTLQRIVTVKYMSTPVPIYLFKQPARLSHLELPFKIVLLQGGTPAARGMIELQVPLTQGADSWFPGYSWNVLVCEQCSEVVHMGWQFSNGADSFTALIVDYIPDSEGEGVMDQFKVGMVAPAWIASLMALNNAAPKSI